MAKKRLSSSTEIIKKDENASATNLLEEAVKKLHNKNKKSSDNLPENIESNKEEQSKRSSVRILIPESDKKQYQDNKVAKSTPSSPRNEKHKNELYTVYKAKHHQLRAKILLDKECQSAPVSPRSSVKIKHKNLYNEDFINKKLSKKDEWSSLKSEIDVSKKQLEILRLKLEAAEMKHNYETGMLRSTVKDLDKSRIENKLTTDKLVAITDELLYIHQIFLEQTGKFIQNQEASSKQPNELIEQQKDILKQANQSLELARIIRNQISPFYIDEQKIDPNQTEQFFAENNKSYNYSHEQIHIATTDNDPEQMSLTGQGLGSI